MLYRNGFSVGLRRYGTHTGGMTGICNPEVDGKRNLADFSRLSDRV